MIICSRVIFIVQLNISSKHTNSEGIFICSHDSALFHIRLSDLSTSNVAQTWPRSLGFRCGFICWLLCLFLLFGCLIFSSRLWLRQRSCMNWKFLAGTSRRAGSCARVRCTTAWTRREHAGWRNMALSEPNTSFQLGRVRNRVWPSAYFSLFSVQTDEFDSTNPVESLLFCRF